VITDPEGERVFVNMPEGAVSDLAPGVAVAAIIENAHESIVDEVQNLADFFASGLTAEQWAERVASKLQQENGGTDDDRPH
jgi:hypothetical protein